MMASVLSIAAATSSGLRHGPAALLLLPGAAGLPCSRTARRSPQACARPLGRSGPGFASRSGHLLFPRSCGPP